MDALQPQALWSCLRFTVLGTRLELAQASERHSYGRPQPPGLVPPLIFQKAHGGWAVDAGRIFSQEHPSSKSD